MLKLDHLTFTHLGAERGYRFSLEIAPGEIASVMGESGSGKSTLLELIAGFLISDGGEMTMEGIDLLPLPPERRPVTTLFQKHNLFEHLSVIANIALGIKGAVDSAKISNTLDKVGLAGLENQKASTLSGGQQQRVALARTMVRDTPILLLDEPFNGLDDENRVQMLNLIKWMALHQKRCVIMVTHDQSDCDAIADQQYRMDDGQLIAV